MEKQSEKTGGEALRRSAEIIGLPLFLIEEGKEVGKVKDIIVDRSASKVTGFLVEDPSWPNPKILPFDKIRSFGVDALVVDGGGILTDFKSGNVFGEAGQVKEYQFDASTGKLLVGKEEQNIVSPKPKSTRKAVQQKVKKRESEKQPAVKSNLVGQIISYAFVAIIILIGAIIVYRKVFLMKIAGPGWDVFAFLGNALQFAGKGIGYWEPHRPPVLSFITSLFFRAGFVSETAIFVADGLIFIFGLVGLYLLLKRRFDSLISFLGTLFFSSINAVIWWAATGMTDVPSVAFSIWAVYLFVMAAEADKRYHWLAWPMLVTAILTRFTAILIVFPIFLILFTRSTILREIKQILTGIAASIVAMIPYFYINLKTFGDVLYPLVIAFGLVTVEGEEFTSTPKIDYAWYLKNLKGLVTTADVSIIFYFLLFLIFIGLIIYSAKNFSKIRQKSSIAAVITVALVIYLIAFFKAGLILRQASIFLVGLVIFSTLKEAAPKNRFMWLDIVMISWFMVYFDFHSHVYPFQRYFVTFAPPFVYFVLLSLNTFIKLWERKIARAALKLVASVLIITLLTSALVWLYRRNPDTAGAALVKDIKGAAKWLKQNDPNIAFRKIYSDSWVDYSWYLKQNVEPMPFFKDKRAGTHELEKYNVDYYLTLGKRELRSYDLIKKVGTNAFIYRKNIAKFTNKPRILYLGVNWQHYIEDVIDFEYFVIYEGGKYQTGKSIFVDNYTLEELQRYPIVLLYNFRWHDRKKMESLLKSYVKSGGKLIIDATANASRMQYNLEGDIFLGVRVLRKSLATYPTIYISPQLSANPVDFSAFLSDGDTWYGTTYNVLPGNLPITNLATVDGSVLIGKQSMGKGTIYWLGYNLVWHAFNRENEAEQKLVKNVFNLALGKPYAQN